MDTQRRWCTNTHSLIVRPEGEPIFSEQATIVQLDDEAAGLFVAVIQHGRTDIGKITIDPDEWPALREAIDRMIGICLEIDGGSAGHGMSGESRLLVS